MSALSELRERVEKASGPDRELDARIALFAGDFSIRMDAGHGYRIFRGKPERYQASILSGSGTEGDACRALGYSVLSVLRYTASIDAALALVERKLPGQGWSLLEDALYLDRMSVKGPITDDLPRIIVIVLLRALESQEQDGG